MRSQFRLFQASEVEQGKRPYYPINAEDSDSNIDGWTLLKLRNDARRVYANYGPLKNAVHTRASYAVGSAWLPIYQGANTAWGKQATNWLTKIWYQTGNIVGPTRNWWDSLQMESRALDVAGEIFVLKFRDADGFPRFQHIPAHRVANPRKPGVIDKDIVATGKYKGNRCIYGIVVDEYAKPIAYNVLGASPDKDKFFPADQMIHLGEWQWCDQTRPVSAISHGILDARDCRDVLDNEKRALTIASSISVLETNPLGAVDVNDPTNFIRMDANPALNTADAPLAPGFETQGALRATQFKDNGEYKYLKAETGSSIQAFQFKRPDGSVTEFLDRLGRNCTNLIFPYDLINNPSSTGSATRSLWTQANNLVEQRQLRLYPAAKQRLLFAIAQAIEIGILDYDESWMEFEFTSPKKPSIDASRNSASDINDIKMGVQSWSDIHGSLGTDTATVAFRKAMDVVEFLKAKKMAQDLYKQDTGETISIPDDYMFNLFPNGSPLPQDSTVSGTGTVAPPDSTDPDDSDLEAADEQDQGAVEGEPTDDDDIGQKEAALV
jgi:hypothetical protein